VAETDCWAKWLATRRYGGDAELRKKFVGQVERFRDEVLDNAEIAEGDTLLDVGCGEGLIGFGALERGAGSVVFSDISQDLLNVCREAANALGVVDRCRFVLAPADDLSAVSSESVDVVTTRSVLIYVHDKRRVFQEFFRVLRPGGRISLFEPINRFGYPEPPGHFAGYDFSRIPECADKLRAVYDELQPPETDPMLNFDERDLFWECRQAGFFPVRLQLKAEVTASEPRPWETFLNAAWNPKVPTIGEAIEQVLSADERERLAAELRPQVEAGTGLWRMAHAWLWATKPAG